MLFAQSHTERIQFTDLLSEAVRKLYYHDYFSYISNAHHLIHWGLINKDKKLTLKGIQFAKGRIGIEKVLYVSPKFSNDPDPEIVRSDSFMYMEDAHENT